MSEVNPRLIKYLFGMSRLFSSVVAVYTDSVHTVKALCYHLFYTSYFVGGLDE